VLRIDENEGLLVASFDGREVEYRLRELDALLPAYATTIHKSQGSEYPAVVITLAMQHYTMLELRGGRRSEVRMTRKWGSCSTRGTITLAADLIEQNRDFQDFVVAHELLHLRAPNHGRLFKALMTAHVPDWRSFDVVR